MKNDILEEHRKRIENYRRWIDKGANSHDRSAQSFLVRLKRYGEARASKLLLNQFKP